MANYIPFEKLEVGKTYYMQSRYWHKVLGRATITELNLMSGRGEVQTDWHLNEDGSPGSCVVEADWDWMWDEMPTEEEQHKRVEESWHESYVPPRQLEGVIYSGKGVPDDWKVKLNELISNLRNTILYDPRFKRDIKGNGYFIWESKLDYPVSPLLIRGNGECDWDSIRYIEKETGFDIHAGERDSCGWLTGVIEDRETNHRILYG